MTKLKKALLSFWLINLLWPKVSYDTFFHNDLYYYAIKVKSKTVPPIVSINQYNIPVQTISDSSEIRLPTSLSDGMVCYSGPGIGGLLIFALAASSATEYCKALIIASG